CAPSWMTRGWTTRRSAAPVPPLGNAPSPAGQDRITVLPSTPCMNATGSESRQPPESELQFDVGSTDDSLERMTELFLRLGDTSRVYAPGRRSYSYVIHHPDDVKRVLVSNHRNYTKGAGLDRVKILLGKGLMTSEGDLWRRQRYMMQG